MVDVTDTSKTYRTGRGERVIVHAVVRQNSVGEDVTFPVKATIFRAARSKRFQIYTPDGKACVLRDHRDNIVGEWEGEPA